MQGPDAAGGRNPARRVWVTRTTPGAIGTATRLEAMGYEPVVAPLLQVRTTPAKLDLADVGALAFTSANGVATFARARRERHLPVFAVGDGTATAARNVGFSSVVSAQGDLQDLVALIAARRSEFRGRVLSPGVRFPVGDIVGDLRAEGLDAVATVVYETTPSPVERHLDFVLGDAGRPLHAVLVYSARAAMRLAELLRARPPLPAAVVCMSPAVARPLPPSSVGEVLCATRPTEQEMLATLSGIRGG